MYDNQNQLKKKVKQPHHTTTTFHYITKEKYLLSYNTAHTIKRLILKSHNQTAFSGVYFKMIKKKNNMNTL